MLVTLAVRKITVASELPYLKVSSWNKLDRMLRITTSNGSQTSTMKLEGKLAGPWVAELSRSWACVAASLGSRKLCVDLRGVTYVDAAGQQLLREIYQKAGAEFLADSPLVTYFVEQATRHSSNNRG